MEYLKLPNTKGLDHRPLFPIKKMTMENIIKFMQFNMDHITDIEAVRKSKRKFYVSVPFRFK